MYRPLVYLPFLIPILTTPVKDELSSSYMPHQVMQARNLSRRFSLEVMLPSTIELKLVVILTAISIGPFQASCYRG
jgi:hypothetical protein